MDAVITIVTGSGSGTPECFNFRPISLKRWGKHWLFSGFVVHIALGKLCWKQSLQPRTGPEIKTLYILTLRTPSPASSSLIFPVPWLCPKYRVRSGNCSSQSPKHPRPCLLTRRERVEFDPDSSKLLGTFIARDSPWNLVPPGEVGKYTKGEQ